MRFGKFKHDVEHHAKDEDQDIFPLNKNDIAWCINAKI